MSKYIVHIAVAVFVPICLYMSVLAYQNKATFPSIIISPRTTYITKPVGPDGYVNYAAAVNQLSGAKNLSPEENGAALYIQAVGLGGNGMPEAVRRKFCTELGIPLLPENGRYFVTDGDYSAEMTEQMLQDFMNQLDKGKEHPWGRRQYRLLSAWLKSNEAPLQQIHRALQKKHFHIPLVTAPRMEMYAYGNWHQILRSISVVDALRARAMLFIHEKSADDALRDLLDCHRLARITSHGPFSLELRIGYALESVSLDTTIEIIKYNGFSLSQLKRYRAQLETLPEPRHPAEYINYEQRFEALQTVISFSRLPPEKRNSIQSLNPRGKAVNGNCIVNLLPRANWNIVLESINRDYDEAVTALKDPSYSDRWDALRLLEKRLARRRMRIKSGYKGMKSDQAMVSKYIADVVSYLLWPECNTEILLYERLVTKIELMKITIALEMYRIKVGRYPKRLEQLIPRQVSQLPRDPFSDRPYHYHRKGAGYVIYSVGPNCRDDGGRNNWNQGFDDISIQISRK